MATSLFVIGWTSLVTALSAAPPRVEKLPLYSHGLDLVGLVIHNEAARSHLGISSEQRSACFQIWESFDREMNRTHSEFSKRPREEQTDQALREELLKCYVPILPGLERILQPSQLRRLRQLGFQESVRQHNLEPLLGDEIATELELTDQQRGTWTEIVRRQQAVIKSLVEASVKRFSQAQLDILDEEQRQRFTELFGEPWRDPDTFPDSFLFEADTPPK